MAREFDTSPMFDQLGTWLMDRGLREASAEEVIRGFGQNLVAAGVSVHRISLGGMLLHPVFGALDIVWNSQGDTISNQMAPRTILTTKEFQDSPFFWAAANNIPFTRFNLAAGTCKPEFPIFKRFRDEGITDYLLFYETYGRTEGTPWADLPAGMEGIILSVSTRRIGGFAQLEVDYLQALMRPLALTVKVATTNQLAHALVDTYLGHYSGNQVLQGLVERGDGGMIDCVLFFCDLRNSTKLAESMPLDRYLALINDYFDCTAGAVSDHGGEVLKFIGDAVMAIFPIDEDNRPAVDMCRAAVNAAREAFDRARLFDVKDGAKQDPDNPGFRFGISIHVGQAMYGNVGTDRRLDFTVVGPAVNQVTRLEGLCKTLETELVLSESFREHYLGDLAPLGGHLLAGMEQEMQVYTLPEFAPASP